MSTAPGRTLYKSLGKTTYSTRAFTSREPLHTTKPPGNGRRKGAGMKQAHLKWIRQALDKARPKEIKISWSDYYPMCPRCGSWEIERRYRSGEIWPYCPICGQKLKTLKAEQVKTLPENWCKDILKRFRRKE